MADPGELASLSTENRTRTKREVTVDYTLLVGDEEVPIKVEIGDNMLSIASSEGESRDISSTLISGNRVSFAADGRHVTAYLADDPVDRDITHVMVEGRNYRIMDAVLAERRAGRKKGTGPELPDSVTPPMPSVVVRVMVSMDERVEKGQGVIVVSAMKTETTLAAPFSGVVSGIHAGEGDSVMPGQVLVDIDRDTEPEEDE